MSAVAQNARAAAEATSPGLRVTCRASPDTSVFDPTRTSADIGSLEKFSSFVPRTLVYKLSICEGISLRKGENPMRILLRVWVSSAQQPPSSPLLGHRLGSNRWRPRTLLAPSILWARLGSPTI